jgi:hypothetical protein
MTNVAHDRLYELVAQRASAMPVHGAERWLVGHGLLVTRALTGELAQAMERRRDANLARNHLLIWRFQEAVEALGDCAVCPLKGIYLLDRIYRDRIADRMLVDMDLLFRGQDMQTAAERLEHGLRLHRSGSADRGMWHLTGAGFAIDGHSSLDHAVGGASEWDALRPRRAIVHEQWVHELDSATVLVHLVGHMFTHGPFTALRWVEDVLLWRAAMAAEDVANVMARALSLGALLRVAAGIQVIEQVLGVSLDVPLTLSWAQQERVVWHARGLWPHLAVGKLPYGLKGSRWRRNLSQLALSDGWSDAVRWGVGKLRDVWELAAPVGRK